MAEIRRYVPGDEGAVSALLRRTLLEVNAHYCPKGEIEWLYDRYTPETVAQIAADGHMYVMTEDGVIVGTGTVVQTGELECEIIAAFLLPEAIGRGLGTQLFDVLEGDEWCAAAKRIWLTSSVNALDFYEKRGYVNPNGYRTRGADSLLTMEIRK
ncbi:GNAT family N-acetyltransferase [Oscillibacter valericigenes]|uniref:GNAT family N-acetyltransferase n=1 Tax=Oscillibacter valericigenes TaxID=351091 RepID=UPI001F2AEAC1|nr:GNAT family N-acetyltransferase [Oscillibacter valericigenes]MCF2665219.1 GNAT family N-acetyltransferase [Oscillibacter valericigenes]